MGDNTWHEFELEQYWEKVRLFLDQEKRFLILQQDDFAFGEIETNLEVYVGGLPEVSFVFKYGCVMVRHKSCTIILHCMYVVFVSI